jgi:acyl-CoA dehydrogenase
MSDILNLPRPAWMTEDVVLLEDQARRFIAAEFAPHLEQWHEDHFYPREVWTKAGAAGLLCASMPEEYGGAGGTFAHEAVIDREYSLAGFDTFGASLHSGIVAPYILRYGTEEQKRRWLPKLATGELVGAIAMSEPGPAPICKVYALSPNARATAMCSTARKPSSPTASTLI